MHIVIFIPSIQLADPSSTQRVADTVIGGVDLVRRTARVAFRAGATRITLFSTDRSDHQSVASDAQVSGCDVEWKDFTGETEIATDFLQDIDGPFWATTADRLISPKAFDTSQTGDVSVVRDNEEIGVYRFESALPAGESLKTAAESIGCRNVKSGSVWHQIKRKQDVEVALGKLLKTLRKPLGRNADGLTAYYINRPISLQMSRVLVNSFVTPNMITTVGLIMGLVAAYLASTGTWSMLVAAGFLLQLSSILDGVDGELARMRLTTSVTGEWFDTVVDDIINLSFMFALGVASAKVLEAQWPMTLAWVSLSVGVLLVGMMYRDLIKAGIASHNNFEWGFEKEDTKPNVFTWIVIGFSYVAKRDTYNLLMALIICANLPHVAFLIMAIGANIIAFSYFLQKFVGLFKKTA